MLNKPPKRQDALLRIRTAFAPTKNSWSSRKRARARAALLRSRKVRDTQIFPTHPPFFTHQIQTPKFAIRPSMYCNPFSHITAIVLLSLSLCANVAGALPSINPTLNPSAAVAKLTSSTGVTLSTATATASTDAAEASASILASLPECGVWLVSPPLKTS